MMKTNDLDELIPLENPAVELLAELIAESGKTQTAIAAGLGTSPAKLTDILKERRRITAEMALRLARYFGTSAQYWMNLQTEHELRLAEEEKGEMIFAEVTAADAVV